MINDLAVDFVDIYISEIHSKYKNLEVSELKRELKWFTYKSDLYKRIYLSDTDGIKNGYLSDWLMEKTIKFHKFFLKKMELKIELHFRKHLKRYDSYTASSLIKKAYFLQNYQVSE